MRTIKDEFNVRWYIRDANDPAGPLCRLLDNAGFKEIALPRRTILTGEIDAEFDTSGLEMAIAGLALLDRVGEHVRADLIIKVEHQARVFLCWRCLTPDGLHIAPPLARPSWMAATIWNRSDRARSSPLCFRKPSVERGYIIVAGEAGEVVAPSTDGPLS